METPPIEFYDFVLKLLHEKTSGLRSTIIVNNLREKFPQYFFNSSGNRFSKEVIDELLDEGYTHVVFLNGTEYYKININGIKLLRKGGYQSVINPKPIIDDAPDFLKIYEDAKNGNSEEATSKPVDYLTALKNNPDAIGYFQPKSELWVNYPKPKPTPNIALAEKIIEDKRIADNKTASEVLHGKPKVLPIAPEEKKRLSRRFHEWYGNNDVKNTFDFIVKAITIVGAIYAFIKWGIPLIQSAN
ncbi:hypothetical protein [Pedobacter aquatilis]|uniref:hypothetical protein n=1 Tax=Pedobacter aquatilis TaxID=351343 RepID=UPI00292F1CAD|nr:hypothetical protein [Pedobacter aquatilis]